MTQPDSLLNAAKKLADIAGLPWPHVQKFYRALQQEQSEVGGPTNWLPKSVGRNIWHAHPHFLSRLIVALAAASDSANAREAVEWTRLLTPMGRNLSIIEGDHVGVINPFEAMLGTYLSNPAEAKYLDRVEFVPDNHTVVVHTFAGESVAWLPGNGAAIPAKAALIRARAVVDGELFLSLAHAINWRQPDQAPLYTGDEDDT